MRYFFKLEQDFVDILCNWTTALPPCTFVLIC